MKLVLLQRDHKDEFSNGYLLDIISFRIYHGQMIIREE